MKESKMSTTTTTQSEHREPVVRDSDSSLERILGAGTRLVHGMLAPTASVIGLIVLKRATWLLVRSLRWRLARLRSSSEVIWEQ
jgi:hypothetical protein